MEWLLVLLAMHFTAIFYCLWATRLIQRQDNKIAELRQQLNDARERLWQARKAGVA